MLHSERLDVTVRRAGRSPSRVEVHQSTLPADERTTERGIPVTTVPRTLLDLAAVLPKHQVERAMNQAEVHRLTDPLTLPHLVARHPRRAHLTTAAFERDRARDRALHADGRRVMRVTWRQLHDECRSIAADLRKMLKGL
jgi:hypothetical protein